MLRDNEISREDAIDALVNQQKMREVDAEFYVAMALGEIEGDEIEVDNARDQDNA